jgi:hypothetical protein
VCSGRHCKRTQGDTEPSQLVSANETGRRVYQAKLRPNRERQTPSKTRRPCEAFSL